MFVLVFLEMEINWVDMIVIKVVILEFVNLNY